MEPLLLDVLRDLKRDIERVEAKMDSKFDTLFQWKWKMAGGTFVILTILSILFHMAEFSMR